MMNPRTAFSVLFNSYSYFGIYFASVFLLHRLSVVKLPLGNADFGYWVLVLGIYVLLMWARLHPSLKPEKHKRRWRDLFIR